MCMGAFLSISYDPVSDLCFSAEEKDSSVGPPLTELWSKHRNNPLTRSSRRLPEPKKIPVLRHTSEWEQKGCYCDFQHGKMSKQAMKEESAVI